MRPSRPGPVPFARSRRRNAKRLRVERRVGAQQVNRDVIPSTLKRYSLTHSLAGTISKGGENLARIYKNAAKVSAI